MKSEEVDDLRSKIRVSESLTKREHYFTAFCPLCPFTEQADVTPNSTNLSAKVSAKSKIATHLLNDH